MINEKRKLQIENMKLEDLVEFFLDYIKVHTYIKLKNISAEYIMQKCDISYREAITYKFGKLRFKLYEIIRIGLDSNAIVRYNHDTFRKIDGNKLNNVLKDFKTNWRIKMTNKKEVFHTWDTWCLIKLKELGKSTMEKWAKAMGYENSFNMNKVAMDNLDKLIITTPSTGRLRFFEVKENVILN